MLFGIASDVIVTGMPKYELMYIVGSQVSDDEIPKVTQEVKKYIQDGGAQVEKQEELGKRKLAYPVKKSKNGYYVVVNFDSDPGKVNEIEHKIRTFPSVIRHLIVNMDEALVRMEKDRKAQAQLKLVRPQVEITKEQVPAKPERKIQIDLDAEIEKALESEDLTK